MLKELHKFVPYARDDEKRIYSEQGNVGDQLSVERGVNCLLQISNGYTPEERLEGLHFEAGDFHAGMKFLQVSILAIYFILFQKVRWCNLLQYNLQLIYAIRGWY